MSRTGKHNETDDVKIAILLSCIGDGGLDVYNTFEFGKKSTLKKLLEAYDTYFLPKKVVATETFKINNLIQGPDQTIEQFSTDHSVSQNL